MIVSLVALFPTHLNLNGDLGNIKVLEQRLAWRGVETKVTLVAKGDSLPADADFILIGHGSEAAWADLQDAVERLKPQLVNAFTAGTSGLAVASGYERLFDRGDQPSFGLQQERVSRVPRVSRFVIAELEGKEALGYVNSDADLIPLMRFRNLLGTLLHGPILAKNEWLAESIIEAIFKARDAALPEIRDKEKADQVADLISKIWELEEPLARE